MEFLNPSFSIISDSLDIVISRKGTQVDMFFVPSKFVERRLGQMQVLKIPPGIFAHLLEMGKHVKSKWKRCLGAHVERYCQRNWQAGLGDFRW